MTGLRKTKEIGGPGGWVLLAMLAGGAAAAASPGFREWLAGSWYYLLFLACPLLHIFLHQGHGHAHGELNPVPGNHPGPAGPVPLVEEAKHDE